MDSAFAWCIYEENGTKSTLCVFWVEYHATHSRDIFGALPDFQQENLKFKFVRKWRECKIHRNCQKPPECVCNFSKSKHPFNSWEETHSFRGPRLKEWNRIRLSVNLKENAGQKVYEVIHQKLRHELHSEFKVLVPFVLWILRCIVLNLTWSDSWVGQRDVEDLPRYFHGAIRDMSFRSNWWLVELEIFLNSKIIGVYFDTKSVGATVTQAKNCLALSKDSKQILSSKFA